ncbi:class I SAM-dependent methyltransferase [Candidatus Palauibacter sp.]|uniref:class I SAM-dependent methyltransferase n=1 Tax=Candidatus Palauibacter sp. TaxID=3101350 RepID=UPI003B02D0A5
MPERATAERVASSAAPDYDGRDLEAMSEAARYHRDILRLFSPYLGERILEVGAGIGNISRLLLEREPARLHALEPSPRMFSLLSRRLRGVPNASAHHAFLSDVIDNRDVAGVDSVLSVNVLEHVEDDARELEMMRHVLRSGGHLCLWVPALPGLYSRFDRSLGHFRRYRKKDVAEKLEAAGFQVVRVAYRDLVGMVAWFVACRLMGQALTPGKVRLYDRLVMPVTERFRHRIDPPVGKNVVAVARKV